MTAPRSREVLKLEQSIKDNRRILGDGGGQARAEERGFLAAFELARRSTQSSDASS